MSDYLYVTADEIGTETGGGAVTRHESTALIGLGATEVWSFPAASRPWGADDEAVQRLAQSPDFKPKLAHFYSGSFSKTVEALQRRGCKVVYTIAAHDIKISREEHQKLGLPFDYPHLNEPAEWEKYSRGYKAADVVVCPSTHSAAVVKAYGGVKDIRIIPHGVELPPVVTPPPKRFSVAYLGAPGADKGVIYLLKAWALLNYRDALLTIAGRNSEHLLPMIRLLNAGNIYLRGWIDRPSTIYNQCRVYVQPSTTEGFGLEALEAMAHSRPVICSRGAGAADIVKLTVQSCDAHALAVAIDAYRREPWRSAADGEEARETAKKYTWEIIRARYQDLWRSL